jgi:hypothetical protein
VKNLDADKKIPGHAGAPAKKILTPSGAPRVSAKKPQDDLRLKAKP